MLTGLNADRICGRMPTGPNADGLNADHSCWFLGGMPTQTVRAIRPIEESQMQTTNPVSRNQTKLNLLRGKSKVCSKLGDRV